MKIAFWSIGKEHESYVKAGIEIFSKRINNYFNLDWEIIPNVRNAGKMGVDELKKAEADIILSRLQKDDFLIVLDERGTQFTSPDLAAQLQKCANAATKRLIFLIGGAYGVHASVLAKAGLKWSLSKLVFPHQLVRLILSEQVYRACSILKNEKYHHN